MQVVETHSHLGGLEFLMIRRRSIWEEIQELVKSGGTKKTDGPGKRPIQKKPSCILMVSELAAELKRKGWRPGRAIMPRLLGEEGLRPTGDLEMQTPLMKERIALEIRLGNSAGEYSPHFATSLALYVTDSIDVGIEILPMKSMQEQMSSGVGYYEGALYDLVRQGRGVPAVPLVLIGIVP